MSVFQKLMALSTATVVAVGSAPAQTKVEFVTPSQVLADHEQVFEDLFGVTFDTGYQYELDQKVIGTGSYTGTNSLGLPFTFEVAYQLPIDLTALGLSASTLAEVQAGNAEFNYVVATLTTALGSRAVHGLTGYRRFPSSPVESRFRLTHSIASDHALLSSTNLAITANLTQIPVIVPQVCQPPANCVDGCYADYQTDLANCINSDPAVVAAKSAFDLALGPALTALAAAIDSAIDEYGSAAVTAANAAHAAGIACDSTGFFATGAGYLGCSLSALAAHQNMTASDLLMAHQDISAAQNQFDATMSPLQADIDAAKLAAQAGCEAASLPALQDCLDGCSPICGLQFIFLWI